MNTDENSKANQPAIKGSAPATLLGAKLRSKIRSHHWTLDFKKGSEELDRLIKDKARLDWLEQHAVSLEVDSPREYLRFGNIREAIDNAIQKAPNGPDQRPATDDSKTL